MYKLFENPDRDVAAVMKDFAVHYYGKAAAVVLQLANELEAARKSDVKEGKHWSFSIQDHSWLTAENIARWRRMLDEAEKKVSPEEGFRIAMLRFGLDCAAVTKMKNYADKEFFHAAKKRILAVAERIARERKLEDAFILKIRQWLQRMEKRVPPKPLPEEFQSLPEGSILTLAPGRAIPVQYKVNDPDAHEGFAVVERWNGKTFLLGTFDYTKNQYGPTACSIDAKDVKAGRYALYKFNRPFRLSPGLSMWGGSWKMSLPLGRFCRADVPESLQKEWELFVSLKFSGDKVYLERGFLVLKRR